MDKLVAAVSRRVNPGGQKEVTVRRYGLDQLEVIVPDVDQAEVDLIKRIVSSAGVLEFRITANPEDPRHKRVIELGTNASGTTVLDGTNPIGRWVQLDTAKMNPAEDRGLVTRTMPDGRVEVLVVLDRFNVTGGFLSRAAASYDNNLQPCVNFSFNSSGAALFGTLTGQNLPDPANRLTSRLGIVLDDTLLSAPTIRSAISGDGQITGSFKQADVDFLVGVLNAGSLPAALQSEPISEQKISPQLGADTIRSGARAMLLATIVVLTFMLLYYRFSGLVADLAVLLNIVLVLALMISIKAAFTLAGLAGLVLSVGMAVDANVLIYERMREEMDRGAGVRTAIRNGFQRAFSTIVDSNLTTLITGIVLFAIGTDQLKGFAVTLVLGLTLNLFTAVFCSRVVFDLAERNRWITTLSMARLFGQPNFQFVKWMVPAIIGSAAFIALGLAAAAQRGQGLFDIDFTGGTSVQVAFKPDQTLDIAAVREAVAALPDAAVSAVTTADIAPGLRYKIDTSLRDDDGVEKALREAFPGKLQTYSMGFGDVTSTVPEKPAEGDKQPAGLTTVAPLDFPEKINLVTLRSTIETALEAEGLGGSPFELEAEGMTSRARPYRNWALSTSLPPDVARKVLDRHAGLSLGQLDRRQGGRQHEGDRGLRPAREPADDRALCLAAVSERGLRPGRGGRPRPRRARDGGVPGAQQVRGARARLGARRRLQDQPRRGGGPAHDRGLLDQRHDRDLRSPARAAREEPVRDPGDGRQGREPDAEPHDPHVGHRVSGHADPLRVRRAGHPRVRVRDARRHHHRQLQHDLHRLADRALAPAPLRPRLADPRRRRLTVGRPSRLPIRPQILGKRDACPTGTRSTWVNLAGRDRAAG
jgi:protein-export membrane protein SecD